jgi:methyl-accepting chemotaxis protein
VQANASQTEEMSGTAEALAAQAEQLQATVARFNLGITTSSRSVAAPRSRSKGAKAAPAKPAAACPVPHATAAKAAPASDHHAGFEEF